MDRHQTGEINPVLIREERKQHQGREQRNHHYPLKIGIQQRLCLSVSFVCRADPHQSRSISTVPNNP
jgi:hypothetical protein